MRLTMVISSLGGGGAQAVCVTLVNGLVRKGWTVELVVLSLEGAVHRDALSREVTVINLGCRHARGALRLLYRYLKDSRPERVLVFNHQLAILLLLLRAVARLRFPIIARAINTLSEKRRYEASFWHKHIVGLAVKMTLHRVEHVIAQSEGMKIDLVKEYGFDQNQVTVINNPIRQDVEDYVATAHSVAERRDYILYVGSLDVQKAVHYTIRAFSRIAPAFPHFRLKIVGNGPLKDQLAEMSREMGLSDRIDFEGFQKEVIPLFVRARVTLLTSRYEGFPNVLCESIAVGTPVVAFDCQSGPREIVIEGQNGYLVPLYDEESLREKLVEALTRPWHRANVAFTAKRFQSESIVAEYERILAQDFAGSPSSTIG